MTEPRPAPGRPLGSRVLHRLNRMTASYGAAALATAVSLAFLVGALVARSATQWLTAFEALAAAVTLIMVFTLQHTQLQQQAGLQRKLDEILRVLPGTDARALQVETAPQEDLDALAERHGSARADAVRPDPLA